MAVSFREAEKKEYTFWKSKPVQKIANKHILSEQIKSGDHIREKYSKINKLPPDYEWHQVDISDDKISIVCDFLNDNYRSGCVSLINVDKVRWETMGKGFFVCVRQIDTQEIVGCIGITARFLQINSDSKLTAEPIYLCCSGDIRDAGMPQVMINELIRRASPTYDVGSFCTDRIIPTPVATIRYYSRPLNYKYLKANDFVSVGDVDDDVAHDQIKIKLKPAKSVYFAEKTDKNVMLVLKLYTEYMKSFNIHHILNLEEIENYFFDDRFVRTVFYENGSGEIVDFLCYRFYTIVNTDRIVTEDDKYGNRIEASNIFMYSSNYIRPDILIMNAFKICAREKRHLMYVPDMMGSNEIILSPVKKSDEDTLDEEDNALFDQHMVKSRKKQFINLFNWKAPQMTQEMVSYLIFN
jgi:hypothetical protein